MDNCNSIINKIYLEKIEWGQAGGRRSIQGWFSIPGDRCQGLRCGCGNEDKKDKVNYSDGELVMRFLT